MTPSEGLTILLPFLRAEHTCYLTAAILDFAKGAFFEANRVSRSKKGQRRNEDPLRIDNFFTSWALNVIFCLMVLPLHPAIWTFYSFVSNTIVKIFTCFRVLCFCNSVIFCTFFETICWYNTTSVLSMKIIMSAVSDKWQYVLVFEIMCKNYV